MSTPKRMAGLWFRFVGSLIFKYDAIVYKTVEHLKMESLREPTKNYWCFFYPQLMVSIKILIDLGGNLNWQS